MTTITLAVPTRARPERFKEMLDSAYASARYPRRIEVCAAIDDDDETRSQYPKGPRYAIIPRDTVMSWRWHVAWTIGTGDIAMLAADDILFRTKGWDEEIIKAFRTWPDSVGGMVYANDLHRVLATPPYVYPTHPFVTRAWTEAVGYFTPPYFDAWEADAWIKFLADDLGRSLYLPDVVIEHMHPMVGKAPLDETYTQGSWGRASERKSAKKRNEVDPALLKVRARQVHQLRARIVDEL